MDGRFLMSIEDECLTVVEGKRDPGEVAGVLQRYLQILSELAPSLPGASGLFNGYGRVYVDVGAHVELAALECDSPIALASAVETQHGLARRAIERLAEEGPHLRLATTKHSGLLQPRAATWGMHENYLIEVPARKLGAVMLPFLATRIYGGAGGVVFPTAEYVAGARPLFLELDWGGGTTSSRALFSTAREEHHMGADRSRYRLHLIAGDSHPSSFNLALVMGATALALKAVQSDAGIARRVGRTRIRGAKESWVSVLKRLNRLCGPDEPPRVDPTAILVQRIYLEAAERWAVAQPAIAPWIPWALGAWRGTLDAFEKDDRAWLNERLDAFLKHGLLESALREAGLAWRDLAGNEAAFSELGLIEQEYHALGAPTLEHLDRLGFGAYRLCPRIPAGSEPEPFVPDVGTRARARARFVRENAGRKDLLVDWSCVHADRGRRFRGLFDPFASEFGAWEDISLEPPARRRRLGLLREWLEGS